MKDSTKTSERNDAEFADLVAQTQADRIASGEEPNSIASPEWLAHKQPNRPFSTTRSGNRQDPLKRFPFVALMSILSLAFLYVPMLFIIIFSFNRGQQALLWHGFSFEWYGRVFSDNNILGATLTSLEVACIATLCSSVIGVLFVLAVDHMSLAGSTLATSLINVSLIIPEVVLGVSTMSLIRLIGLTPGFLPLVLAHTTFCIPFVVMPIRSRLSTLDHTCFEAAEDLGASTLQTVRRITLPMLTPAIVSGALMAFVVSMDDFMISNFLTSAGTTTLPIYIFSLIRKGVNPSVNVVATLLLLLAVIVTITSTLLTRSQNRK
ncbi:ABC transporter permease [Bifidobacterium aquikefiricola]|uniref:Spermidine/putrescine transport system permease protein PotC n=2 Tax=Bifidobacterium TaxID=1678 RepID=A0AB39U795_9BIFI